MRLQFRTILFKEEKRVLVGASYIDNPGLFVVTVTGSRGGFPEPTRKEELLRCPHLFC